MITNVKITQVIGQFKRFGRGPGLLMRGEIDDGACQIPVHGYLQTFPLGLVSSFLIGQEVSFFLHGHGQRMRAELLPFDNQTGPVLSHVIGILVRLANEAGTQQLEELPMLTLKQCNVLPPPPQPEAEELNRLLQLDINAEPPEEEHPF